jgi:hypothetical protein
MNPPDHPSDGSAGDANYALIGASFTTYRQPEPAIETLIHQALGDAERILNLGAGAGSYEPRDRKVTPVEPSATMRAQRPADLAPAINAAAESLPFPDHHFDAAMTTFSVHQWTNLTAGLREMRRVTTGPLIILTCDPILVQNFWLNDYAPEVLATEARRYPALPHIAQILGGTTRVLPVPIPLHCRDGFNEAYYGRPEMLLSPTARSACSAWSFVDEATSDHYVSSLREALETGAWDRRHGHLRTEPHYDGSLRLLISLR